MKQALTVIPAHNEEETIREVVLRTIRHTDVSVTDDGSRDRTPEILAELLEESRQGKFPHTLHVITHDKATHIPRGIQDGLRYGIESGYEWIITMDAGLSHDPDAIPEFLAVEDSVDVVIGARTNVQDVPTYRRCVSFCAARVMNYALSRSWFNLLGPGIGDTTSGYRRYSRRAAKVLAEAPLKSKAFDFHMESLALCVRAGMRTSEIPITYVFSNSSFNRRVLVLAMKFALHLIRTKKGVVTA